MIDWITQDWVLQGLVWAVYAHLMLSIRRSIRGLDNP